MLLAWRNLTVGGTGKTPFVLYLAEKLSKGSKVGILSRDTELGPKATEDDENMALPANVIRAINPTIQRRAETDKRAGRSDHYP